MKLTEEGFREAVDLLQALLRIDTTNPPGNERPATEKVAEVLAADGIESEILEPEPDRTNLVARLKALATPGGPMKPALLLSSHLDVVPATNTEAWTHPPFAGAEADGCLWGRGAIDMKGMAAMAITVMCLMKRNGVALDRDLVFVALADEETGCRLGSEHLVEAHSDLLGDVEYVINEVGGFTREIEGRRFYPVQVGEKGIAWLRVHVKGKPGHGSLPAPDSVVARMGHAMHRLARARLPMHRTDAAVAFLEGVAAHVKFPHRAILPLLGKPGAAGGFVLDRLIGDPDQRATLQALVCNTANPTIVRAGSKINVVPGEATFEIDGRLLPGQRAADLVREVEEVIGSEFEVEVLSEREATVFSADTPLFEVIREVMRERDPEGVVVPYLIPGFTDSSNWGKLGATCYGFYPLKLPRELDFSSLFHGIDERIPLDAFRFGIETLYEVIERFAGKAQG